MIDAYTISFSHRTMETLYYKIVKVSPAQLDVKTHSWVGAPPDIEVGKIYKFRIDGAQHILEGQPGGYLRTVRT